MDPAAWWLLALAFLCMIICSLDRVAMSVAILPMALEFGFSETTKVGEERMGWGVKKGGRGRKRKMRRKTFIF